MPGAATTLERTRPRQGWGRGAKRQGRAQSPSLARRWRRAREGLRCGAACRSVVEPDRGSAKASCYGSLRFLRWQMTSRGGSRSVPARAVGVCAIRGLSLSLLHAIRSVERWTRAYVLWEESDRGPSTAARGQARCAPAPTIRSALRGRTRGRSAGCAPGRVSTSVCSPQVVLCWPEVS